MGLGDSFVLRGSFALTGSRYSPLHGLDRLGNALGLAPSSPWSSNATIRCFEPSSAVMMTWIPSPVLGSRSTCIMATSGVGRGCGQVHLLTI